MYVKYIVEKRFKKEIREKIYFKHIWKTHVEYTYILHTRLVYQTIM